MTGVDVVLTSDSVIGGPTAASVTESVENLVRRPSGFLAQLVSMLLLAATYFIAGRLGLSLAFVNESATGVWPPTGIALAAVLVFGSWIWPGIAVGAFVVNLTTSGSIPASLGIGAGNTLEALAAAYLVRRAAGGHRAFERAPDVVRFAALAGLVAPAIAATIGVTSLLLAGLTSAADYMPVWVTWWLGDAGGAIVVAPPLVLAWTDRSRLVPGRRLEALLLVAALLAMGMIVFGGWSRFSLSHYPLSFLCIPVLLWPAFRFGPRETALSVLVLTTSAVLGTLRGFGPFGQGDPNESLLFVQLFAGVASVTAATIAALIDERRRLNSHLEGRVIERTEQLRTINDELRAEISKRERAQAALRASESRLLEAQEVAHVGSWEWDVPANTIWWSEELYRICGLDKESFTTTYEGFLELVHPDDRRHVMAAVSEGLATGQPFALEHRILRPGGSQRTLAARGRVVRDENGRIVRMLGTGQDISDHKRAEQEHRQLLAEQAARRQAEEASRMKDQFLAMISHELRTPLNTVLGWAHMLARGSVDEASAAKALQIIERNAQAQAHLIDDLLDVSRFVAGQIRLDMRPTELGPIVRAALESIESTAAARHVQLDVCDEPGVDLAGAAVRVVADRQRLQQIVWNLLSNAVKFTPAGGRVAIDVTTVDNRVELRVTDSGSGIDPAHLEHVFEPFWQADTSHTRTNAGLGLGLTIVRYLAEAHGGTVRAASAGPGRGASLTVSLPRA